MNSIEQPVPTTNNTTNARFANLDLLRWICSIFVVFEHFCESSAHNAFGFAQESSLIAYFGLRFLYGIARVAVPVFFILSGYLSINSKSQKVGKVINLFVMTIAYSFISYFFVMFVGIIRHEFVFSFYEFIYHFLAKNYFLYLYCGLYMLSPYINKCLVNLTQKQYKVLLIIGFSLFSLWSTIINTFNGIRNVEVSGVYFVTAWGTDMGFNIANFSMLYILGGYLKSYYHPNKKRDLIASISAICLSSIVVTVLKQFFESFAKAFWYYDSIFVVISALMLTIIFLNIDLKQNKLISYLGTCSFGIFLIHGFVNAVFEKLVTIESIVSSGFWGVILGILIFVFGVHCVSVGVTSVIKLISIPINKKWKTTKIYNVKFYQE